MAAPPRRDERTDSAGWRPPRVTAPAAQAPPRSDERPLAIAAPAINLPKGGGAIRGLGEKFAANPVTGTCSLSVPLATSPGRSGFGPSLSLSYDSGAGNGPFGLGWQLSLPAIMRKTDKGLPRYRDADDSDVFILSGAEDLVPEYRKGTPTGEWTRDPDGGFVRHEERHGGYAIRCYRPRIEGVFARIERWTSETDPSDVFWRSISRDNVTSVYGKTGSSRIADPADARRIFSWLICERYDDKGNAVLYQYKSEDADSIEALAANEKNRSRGAQRYLKRVKYGNSTPRQPSEDLDQRTDWHFEIVCDYGEHDRNNPAPLDAGKWLCRHDPFSTYRSGFEVRTYRLCQRVLMFHHFPLEDIGSNCVVKSTDLAYRSSRSVVEDGQKGHPVASFIASVTHTSYRRRAAGGYDRKSMPPLTFGYSEPRTDDEIRTVSIESARNLPAGLDGTTYRWIDLDGEGIPGILTEQATAWFYKRNLSPLAATQERGGPRNTAVFAPVEIVAEKPSVQSLGAGRWQFHDLAGDGRPDLAQFEPPLAGFFERGEHDEWSNFVPFRALPNVDWEDANLRFVDLTGDGLADILITEDDAFRWYPSRGEQGFGAAERTLQALDEERGARLLFADGTQSVYLADMSGDGLSDLVRIRNGDICYWPNLGYGRFGPKVTMDRAPWFDAPDQFSQERIRLADVDGSGATDIVYLGRAGITLYPNQAGNAWGPARELGRGLPTDDLTALDVVDLFGNGTACLVWSSPLPGAARRPMRYVDLMGGRKPHLLVSVANSRGSATQIEYTASTVFYLQDKAAGTPWITKLPFPVHVVTKVTVTDNWRRTAFSTTYSYHHGYFDGIEREFRGFGRVEQIDVEDYGTFTQGNAASPYITSDLTLYQPPVKTVTWFHTGAATDKNAILSQFAREYFPQSFAARPPTATVDPAYTEKGIPEPALESVNLTTEEWRQALRACKGMPLRQEVYELDVDALRPAAGNVAREVPVRLFSATSHGCEIRCLQPKGANPHAVFAVSETEAVSYQYELDLRSPASGAIGSAILPDPRVAHTLNLTFDDYGQVQQSVMAAYARTRQFDDPDLAAEADLIREVQRLPQLTYRETRYTNEVIDPAPESAPVRTHRLPVPCEVQTYDITGVAPTGGYFERSELRRWRFSSRYAATSPARAIGRKQYHEIPQSTAPQMRLVEHTRTLFFEDDDTHPDAANRYLKVPLPLGTLGKLALPCESYKLAFTRGLLDAIFADGQLDEVTPHGASVFDTLRDPVASGYVQGTHFGAPGPDDSSEEYWIRSGVAGFGDSPQQHFYRPEKYTDPFGNVTTLEYGKYDLFVASRTDAVGNVVSIETFDYRVLLPAEVKDVNDNFVAVSFDVLGMPAATALMGKQRTESGDSVSGINPDVSAADVEAFLTGSFDPGVAARWLGTATTRFVYDFGASVAADGTLRYAARPPSSCGIAREAHVQSGTPVKIQVGIEYSDGLGAVLVRKAQAEPDPESTQATPPLRWIATGKTVLNNKGNAVKQYEPYFSATEHRFDAPEAEAAAGVSSVLYYDAPGRLVRTELPDGTLTRVEFSAWRMSAYDANDTVLESKWFSDRGSPPSAATEPTGPETRAAWLARVHANTPVETHLDATGRAAIAIARNRVADPAGLLDINGRRWRDERYVTVTRFDAGRLIWIRDVRGNLGTQYLWPSKPDGDLPRTARDSTPAGNPNNDVGARAPTYDVAGRVLFERRADAGNRWMLPEASGSPIATWEINQWRDQNDVAVVERRVFFNSYDAVRRPTAAWLRIDGGAPAMVERLEYRDVDNPDGTPNLQLAADRAANLIGQLVRHYDPSGLTETVRRDFRDNVVEVARRLTNQTNVSFVDWQADPLTKLEAETFRTLSESDALNRVTLRYNWHRSAAMVAAEQSTYNERGVLRSRRLLVRAARTPAGPSGAANAAAPGEIQELRYNSRGQIVYRRLGNNTLTQYDYDASTFRLKQLRTTRPSDAGGFPGRRSTLTDPSIVQQLLYTYDPLGNITEIVDDAYEPVFFQNQQVGARSWFEYDALYRLGVARGREDGARTGAPSHVEGPPRSRTFATNETSPGAIRRYEQQYRYDPAGNLERMHHEAGIATWTRRFEYATDNNRLVATWDTDDEREVADPTAVVEHRYDSRGNLLNVARSNPRFDLRWDYRDAVLGIDLGGGGVARYQYDSAKQRTRKRVASQAGGAYWERISLGQYELYRRYDAGGSVVEEIESHQLFAGEDRVLLVDDVITAPGAAHPRPDGQTVRAQTLFRFQYGNHLGSACLELDGSAEVVSYEEFHPYGTTAYAAKNDGLEAPQKRYRFTGIERDEESGLDYHGARYYVPPLARWASADPAGMAAGLNAYIYVSANPVRYVDPGGTNGYERFKGAYVSIFDQLLFMKSDMFGHTEDFKQAYADWNIGNAAAKSPTLKGVRDDVLNNDLSAGVMGGTLGLISAVVPNAPNEGNSPSATYNEYYSMMRFASVGATTIVSGVEMVQSLPTLPPRPGPPPPTGLVPVTVGVSAVEVPAVVAPEIGNVVAMASSSSQSKSSTKESSEPYKSKVERPPTGPEEVTQAYLKDQGVTKVSELAFKAYWNLMEKLGVDRLIKDLGVIVYEQIQLFEGRVVNGRSVLQPLGRIPDALLVDPATGGQVVSEFTAMKEIAVGSQKYAQLETQLSAFSRAAAGESTIWARLPNGSFIEVTSATQTIGSYPHWSAANVSTVQACFAACF